MYNNPASGTCTSKPTPSHAHFIYFIPGHTHNWNKYALSNALAALHHNRLFTKIIDLHHQFVTFSAVILIDHTHTVRNEESLATWSTAAHCQQQHVSGRSLHNHVAWNESQGTRGY